MATTSNLPDTENFHVAALATAWEIVKASYDLQNLIGKRDDNLESVTNAVIKAYKAIRDDEPIVRK